MSYKHKYGAPAILSFIIPGLGQIIKGELLKAIGIWALLLICAILKL